MTALRLALAAGAQQVAPRVVALVMDPIRHEAQVVRDGVAQAEQRMALVVALDLDVIMGCPCLCHITALSHTVGAPCTCS